MFVFDRIAGELLVWGKAEGLKDFISPVGIAVGPGGDILVSTPWPYTPMYTEMKDRIRVFDYSKYNLVTPIIEPMQMSLEEVTQALAKCYMKFYSHKMLEIAGMEEGFKKDYLMSAMRLMMKEQCSAFRMTGIRCPISALSSRCRR